MIDLNSVEKLEQLAVDFHTQAVTDLLAVQRLHIAYENCDDELVKEYSIDVLEHLACSKKIFDQMSDVFIEKR